MRWGVALLVNYKNRVVVYAGVERIGFLVMAMNTKAKTFNTPRNKKAGS